MSTQNQNSTQQRHTPTQMNFPYSSLAELKEDTCTIRSLMALGIRVYIKRANRDCEWGIANATRWNNAAGYYVCRWENNGLPKSWSEYVMSLIEWDAVVPSASPNKEPKP